MAWTAKLPEVQHIHSNVYIKSRVTSFIKNKMGAERKIEEWSVLVEEWNKESRVTADLDTVDKGYLQQLLEEMDEEKYSW
jgi:hypothetical protein